MKILGVILIVVGVVCLVYGGIKYTKREQVIDIGPLKVDAQREKTLPIPPLVGIVVLATGITLLLIKK